MTASAEKTFVENKPKSCVGLLPVVAGGALPLAFSGQIIATTAMPMAEANLGSVDQTTRPARW